MTFRTRLVLATTVAVVIAVLVASTASFLAARDSLLGAADNSLTAAAQKITAGQQITTTTATLGQVIDSQGTLVSGGQLPITPQARLVAAGRAPSFFTTIDVGGDQLRELVEPLPAGTLFGSLALTAGVPAARLRLRLRPALRFPDGVAARVRGLAVVGIITLIAQDLSTVAAIVLANSRGANGALVLYSYGWQVFFIIYAGLAVPVATSAFPVLSARGADKTPGARA